MNFVFLEINLQSEAESNIMLKQWPKIAVWLSLKRKSLFRSASLKHMIYGRWNEGTQCWWLTWKLILPIHICSQIQSLKDRDQNTCIAKANKYYDVIAEMLIPFRLRIFQDKISTDLPTWFTSGRKMWPLLSSLLHP